MTALYFSVLDQHWRTADPVTAKQWWQPVLSTARGNRQVVSAQLVVNGVQVIIGGISILFLLLSSTAAIGRFKRYDGVVRNGGVIDMVSMLRDSALPAIIAGGENVAVSQTVRLRRARQIPVMQEPSAFFSFLCMD